MSNMAVKPGLPLWSKALMVLAALGLIAVFVGGLMGIMGIKELGRQWLNPAAIAHAARDVGEFPTPLPSGYRYLMGLSLAPGLDIVTIEHAPEKQLITFVAVDGTNDADVKNVLEHGYSIGLVMLTTTAQFTGVKQQGTTTVAKHQMPYIIGTTVDVSKREAEGMVGAVQIPVKEHRKNILIYALETTDVPYNQQITMDLLNSIKSF